MPKCTATTLSFGRLGRRVIEGDFSGGAISSDAGLMLLRQVDQRIGLSRQVAAVLHDPRDPDRVTHSLRELVAQRLYALCCGYEDLNDHDRLRHDALMQTAVGTVDVLGSSPTLCRMEKCASRADAVALNGVLVEQFIAAQGKTAPAELILDIDASDIPLHGDQEQREYHGYYDCYCYLPLYVYCGKSLLACVLRRSRIDGAKHAAAVIKLMVTRLRQAWPLTRIVVRGDSGFCRRKLLTWCERSGVDYVIGLSRNAALHAQVAAWEEEMQEAYERDPEQGKQRRIGEFTYQAKSWKYPRRVITRLEYGALGRNPRFILTTLQGDAEQLYDGVYCQRGEAENRIKETQLDLFGTRTSCHHFHSNWLRILLAGLAYTLMQRLKELALQGTELARASSATIRVRLLKMGAVIVRNTRRIRLFLAGQHPLQEVFQKAVLALSG